jgi:membrane dipeptidase
MAATFPPGLGYERATTCVPPEAVPEIARVLERRGYDAAARSAVLGGNWLRIARECW